MIDDIEGRVGRIVDSLTASTPGSIGAAESPIALDSLAVVTLIMRLEEEFEMVMMADQLTHERFGSVATIADAVRISLAQQVQSTSKMLLDNEFDVDETIVDVLFRRAASTPSAPYLTWFPDRGEPEVLTYGGLDERSRVIAAWLAGPDGLRGSRVGVLAVNDIDTVVALFAVLRAGGTCLLLNPSDPIDRLRSILSAHPTVAVLRSSHVPDVLSELARLIPMWDPTAAVIDSAVDHVPTPGMAAFMFGTSGSTAASKLVVQSHRAVLANAHGLRRHHSLRAEDTIAGGLPIHHVNGVHFTVVGVLNAGAHVLLPQSLSPLPYRAMLDAHRPRIASVVPTVLEALLVTGRGWRPPSSLQYVVTAAAPLTASLARRVMEAFGLRVVQGYGLTETTNFSTTLPIDLADGDYRALILDAQIPTVGIAFPGNEVAVLSPTGDVLDQGETGEICMRGPNIMDGYASAPDLTRDAFAGGWFHSGDLGHWHVGPGNRRYYTLTGRIKNIANVKGEAVSLEELEHSLLAVPAVVDAACVALPHPLLGEEVVAFMILREGTVDEVRLQLAYTVSPNALPRRWYEVDTIPRTATGKLQRGIVLDYVPAEVIQ
ncbi:AMP-binding protein [Nocardia sp. NPDC058114]|uniref:AMP-binding protein n=1 Tax=Nocardia sp. NPDC058114 TaxID=3346346 RepID=UPI0036DA845D